MATDDERRCVASALRMCKSHVDAAGWFWLIDEFGGAHVVASSKERLVRGTALLADLIEPYRGHGGRAILCVHCESASWCGCEPGDEEGGCDFEPSVTEGEPPYNLYSLYEDVFRRRPRDEYAIEDDEVDELVDALLDICNAPGHDVIQRPQPSCDRDAPEALADEMDAHWLGHEGMEDSPVARWSRELREALGEAE